VCPRPLLLEIRSDCIVATTDAPPFDFLVRDYAVTYPFAYEPLHRFNLGIYLAPPELTAQEALRRWLDERFTDRPKDTVAWLFALNQVICRSLSYQWRDEPGIQPSLTTIALGSGSCRDFAVVLIDCARTLGLAARFVGGYHYGVGSSGSPHRAMHAWVEGSGSHARLVLRQHLCAGRPCRCGGERESDSRRVRQRDIGGRSIDD
jgi:transglutaminase-like putative cysteine protease